jgi:glutaredoxin
MRPFPFRKSAMSRPVVVLVLALAAFGGWRHFAAADADTDADAPSADAVAVLPDGRGTVMVFGRDGCGYTRRTLEFLKENAVPTTYIDIDDPAMQAAFQDRFRESPVNQGGYRLPIVEINGHASARPDPSGLLSDFRISQRIAARTKATN